MDRTVLPIQLPPRPNLTELDARNVKAPARSEVAAPAGAPNVVIVLLDDVGFGTGETFGGPVPMPTSTGWRKEGCGTTISTPPPCARPPEWR